MIDRWPHPACLDDAELLRSCEVGRGRAGGPGGQHRNKVETLVTITYTPTGMEAHAGERRSQSENKGVAVFRLRLMLATRVRVSPPRPRGLEAVDAPWTSALWRSRVAGGRVRCNAEHRDFPSMLAEALDVLADAGWEPVSAAGRLGTTPSQLTRFIGAHPPAFVRMNEERGKRGIRPLR